MNTKTLALNRRFTYGQVNVVESAGIEPTYTGSKPVTLTDVLALNIMPTNFLLRLLCKLP